jgi:hypothetical protein
VLTDIASIVPLTNNCGGQAISELGGALGQPGPRQVMIDPAWKE